MVNLRDFGLGPCCATPPMVQAWPLRESGAEQSGMAGTHLHAPHALLHVLPELRHIPGQLRQRLVAARAAGCIHHQAKRNQPLKYRPEPEHLKSPAFRQTTSNWSSGTSTRLKCHLFGRDQGCSASQAHLRLSFATCLQTLHTTATQRPHPGSRRRRRRWRGCRRCAAAWRW